MGKNKEAEYMKKQIIKSKVRSGYKDIQQEIPMTEAITQFMIAAIKERASFDPSMLFFAWHFNENSLSSPLWTAMMKTYEKILSDTKDKNGWKWLKEQFINSLIWFLPHPNTQKDEEKDDENDEMEGALKKTLFYELLKRVRVQNKKQSKLLLKDKIDAIQTQKGSDWQQLIKYDVIT